MSVHTLNLRPEKVDGSYSCVEFVDKWLSSTWHIWFQGFGYLMVLIRINITTSM